MNSIHTKHAKLLAEEAKNARLNQPWGQTRSLVSCVGTAAYIGAMLFIFANIYIYVFSEVTAAEGAGPEPEFIPRKIMPK
jgi:hypothetical protein